MFRFVFFGTECVIKSANKALRENEQHESGWKGGGEKEREVGAAKYHFSGWHVKWDI